MMEEDAFSMAFPPYRPSHFHSKTYNSLLRILSHLSPDEVAHTCLDHDTITQAFNITQHTCLDHDSITQAFNITQDARLLDSTIMEEGEISGDFASADATISQQIKPGNSFPNKDKYRKKRAEKNRELGVKRLKLIPLQKPKTITYCRHYMKGRCNEGEKCKFSHDTVPETKSKACVHFARHSCMKGHDCPFDHQLSKYTCSNVVSNGSCSRGRACLFSHQVPINQCIPTPTNACKLESKSPLPLGNTNFSMPLNNHGTSFVQQNHFTNSKGAETSQTKPTSAPKGIRFINVANLSSSTPKQDTITPNKGSLVHNGTCADKSKNTAEIPKKFPAVTPKGINFLSFGKGSVCSFKSSIQSTAQNLPQAALFSHNEISDKKQSIVERMKSKFLGKDSTNDSVRDRSHCKSVQEVKKASNNSLTSNVTSATLLTLPFVSHQSSGGPVSGYHKQASNLGQRTLISTLAFAAEHESDIKMKCPTVDSPV